MNDQQTKEYIDRQIDEKLNSLIASGRLAPTSYQQPVTNNQISAPVPTPSVLGSSTSESTSWAEASSSAKDQALDQAENSQKGLVLTSDQLAAQTKNTLSAMNDLLSATDLKLDTLTATGQSNLASTNVAGTFSQDGTLIIDYGRQINVLGSTLFLQNDPLAGCATSPDPVSKSPNETGSSCASGILVDIGAGRASFDKGGNLKITGTLFAAGVETKELTVYTDEGSAKTVGTSQIAAGKSQVTIFTTAIKPEAKVLLTATGSTGGNSLYVAQKLEFEGFTVALDGPPVSRAIEFDWFVVNTQISSLP